MHLKTLRTSTFPISQNAADTHFVSATGMHLRKALLTSWPSSAGGIFKTPPSEGLLNITRSNKRPSG